MTKYSQALIDHFTVDGRKPIFIEKSFEIAEETPIEDILYTYNEMPCRGYLIEEQGIFLENAVHFSKKPAFCFLYPSVLLDVPFEMHPYVIAMKKAFNEGIKWNDPKWEEIQKLKDY
jgi:hypothetical protein